MSDQRTPGYRGALPPRTDALARPWAVAVVVIFALVFILALANVPSRLFPESSPTPIPLPSVSATASASADASASPGASATVELSASPAASSSEPPSSPPSVSPEATATP